ncbi:MAG: hypothetical protein Alpg2KO_12490 [Alphaproteobacteria bacterium]
MSERTKTTGRVLALLGVFALGACASSDAPETAISDPFEPVNRVTHSFNLAADTLVLRPAAETYRFLVPDLMRDGVHNFLDNLTTPVSAANQLLQGDVDGSVTELKRFFLNTTIGGLGFSDQATTLGYVQETEDFGQTLAVWGVPDGPYIELPLLGPSSLRDATGRVADSFLDPVSVWTMTQGLQEVSIPRAALTALDARERNIEAIDALQEQSTDYYSTLRSVYKQRRDSQIADGEVMLEEIE